jgi:superfamily II DNA or RNA helicase
VSRRLTDFQARRVDDLVRLLRKPYSLAVLGDPVGTGKTVVALAVAARLLDLNKVKRVLVVAPNATVRTIWEERSEHLRHSLLSQSITVITAAHLPQQPLARRTPTLVVVDEAHRRLRRADLNRLIASGPGGSHRRLLLSATPFQISVGDLQDLLSIGDRDQEDNPVAAHLKTYGEKVTGLARLAHLKDGPPEVIDELHTLRDNWLREATTIMVKPISARDRAAINLPHHKLPDETLVAIPGRWAEAFHIARIVPELTKPQAGSRSRATDSFQRGLASSVEAFWASAPGKKLQDDENLSSLSKELERSLGSGIHHPKIQATADWCAAEVKRGHHVAVFCVWDKTAEALATVLEKVLDPAHVARPPGQSVSKDVRDRFRDPRAKPLVLILQDRFSESIDLDGGNPSLVHHDLPWNPARLQQRWGRLVRASSGFKKIPSSRMFVPVLDHESDRRVAQTVRKRSGIGDVLLSQATVLRDTSDEAMVLPEWFLRALAIGSGK